MIKKRKIKEAEIPTASMADIAFLLLLFFLVATVIDVDTGIGLTLPEYVPPEEIKEVEVPKDRMAAVLINENGDVLVDGQPTSIFQIKNNLKPRIVSKIDLPSNKKLIVSVKTDRKTNYNPYIQALDQIKLAYFKVRDNFSLQNYVKNFIDLFPKKKVVVKIKFLILFFLVELEAEKS